MNKEIKQQIRKANNLIHREDWAGKAYSWFGWANRPQYREIWRLSDKRKVKAAAKHAVKVFARNSDGSFRRCGKVRAEARRSLAELIFNLADNAMCEMLQKRI